MLAARLRQIHARDDPEFDRQRLQDHCHDVRQQNDAEQGVAKSRAARDIRGPIAWVHIANRDHIAGPGKGAHLAPETAHALGHCDSTMRLRQAWPKRWLHEVFNEI